MTELNRDTKEFEIMKLQSDIFKILVEQERQQAIIESLQKSKIELLNQLNQLENG
jgi:hypothetical protein